MELAGKNVVVTGGTGALGTAVVRRLLDLGATCYLPAIDRGEVDRFVARRDVDPDARLFMREPVDLRQEGEVEAYYGSLPELWASIHCAGGFAMSPLESTGLKDFRHMLDMNTVSAFLCCREAVGRMTGGGRLVNVAARPALEARGGAGMAAYTASKAAVAALTESLAEELAGRGIWVNAVVPSIMDTPANRAAMPEADHASWPKVEEVAESIVFLASPSNRVTRGALVPVYGST